MLGAEKAASKTVDCGAGALGLLGLVLPAGLEEARHEAQCLGGRAMEVGARTGRPEE